MQYADDGGRAAPKRLWHMPEAPPYRVSPNPLRAAVRCATVVAGPSFAGPSPPARSPSPYRSAPCRPPCPRTAPPAHRRGAARPVPRPRGRAGTRAGRAPCGGTARRPRPDRRGTGGRPARTGRSPAPSHAGHTLRPGGPLLPRSGAGARLDGGHEPAAVTTRTAVHRRARRARAPTGGPGEVRRGRARGRHRRARRPDGVPVGVTVGRWRDPVRHPPVRRTRPGPPATPVCRPRPCPGAAAWRGGSPRAARGSSDTRRTGR